ncbi:MAG: hypothetical protein KDC48_14440, partial [Planctomycetes bacterium]|nr:hypothetical protein [Planctomycetota bacterium]
MKQPSTRASVSLLTLITFTACGGGGGGGSSDWQAASNGIEGGVVLSVASDGASALYAGTASGGVFKSTDQGATWTATSSGLPDAVVEPLGGYAAVAALAVDPVTPTTVYAGLWRGGVYVSTNGG